MNKNFDYRQVAKWNDTQFISQIPNPRGLNQLRKGLEYFNSLDKELKLLSITILEANRLIRKEKSNILNLLYRYRELLINSPSDESYEYDWIYETHKLEFNIYESIINIIHKYDHNE